MCQPMVSHQVAIYFLEVCMILFMASSDVKAFLEKVNSDPALVAKAKAIGTSDYDKVIAFAKELGFSFTAGDMVDHFSDSIGDSSELSEGDLSSVAGGTVTASAAAVAGGVAAAAGVVSAGAAVTSTTQGSGW